MRKNLFGVVLIDGESSKGFNFSWILRTGGIKDASESGSHLRVMEIGAGSGSAKRRRGRRGRIRKEAMKNYELLNEKEE